MVCTSGDPLKLHRIAIYLYITIPSIYSGMLQNFPDEDICFVTLSQSKIYLPMSTDAIDTHVIKLKKK